MATNVVMPQMGESIAEGTIVRWIKKVGDPVDRDEPLFEISTDKVDAEIPSPSAGVLTEIKVKEGETVPVNSVVAVIGGAGEAAAPRSGRERRHAEPAGAEAAAARCRAGVPRPRRDAPRPTQTPADAGRRRRGAAAAEVLAARPPDREGTQRRHPPDPGHRHQRPRDQERHPRLHRIRRRCARQRAGSAPTRGARRRRARRISPGENVQIVPMSVMRKKIAEHMVLSAHTSPHVYSVYEVNFGRVSRAARQEARRIRGGGRQAHLHGVHRQGDRRRAAPVPDGQCLDRRRNIVYKKDINLGIAVALDNGLIVPVIRNADEKNLLGLSRAINDLAARARVEEAQPRRSPGRHLHDHQSRASSARSTACR